MAFGTGPAHPWLLAAGVGLVSFTSVPFGLAVGALAPHELEGVLVLIGVVGIQLTLDSSQAIARFLPFWGPQRLMDHSIDPTASIGAAIPVNLLYATMLFVIAAYIMHRRAPAFAVPRLRGRAAFLIRGGGARRSA